ncbi:MAG: hypothetical protein R3287_11990 [Anderseniella sp.]|nr:hypothetical protein [Anderseniella sp.]
MTGLRRFATFAPALAGFGLLTAIAPSQGEAQVRCLFALPDPGSGEVRIERLNTLAEGTSRGVIKCSASDRRADIWTLDIGNSPTAGVRTAPLFRAAIVGKLERLAQLTVTGKARLTIFERASTAAQTRAGTVSRRHRFQRFMTLCDASPAPDPLNCWYGTARIKGRITMADLDRNGELDTALHEISVFDGGSKLHVIAFNTELAKDPADHAGAWLEALHATTGLLAR